MAIEMCVEEYRYRIVHTKNGFVPQRMDMCEMIFHDFIEHGRRIIRAKLEKAQAYIQDMAKEPVDFTTVQVVQALPVEFTEDERIAELKTLLATKKNRTFWLARSHC